LQAEIAAIIKSILLLLGKYPELDLSKDIDKLAIRNIFVMEAFQEEQPNVVLITNAGIRIQLVLNNFNFEVADLFVKLPPYASYLQSCESGHERHSEAIPESGLASLGEAWYHQSVWTGESLLSLVSTTSQSQNDFRLQLL